VRSCSADCQIKPSVTQLFLCSWRCVKKIALVTKAEHQGGNWVEAGNPSAGTLPQTVEKITEKNRTVTKNEQASRDSSRDSKIDVTIRTGSDEEK